MIDVIIVFAILVSIFISILILGGYRLRYASCVSMENPYYFKCDGVFVVTKMLNKIDINIFLD